MKKLLILLLVIAGLQASAQVPQKVNTWYEYKLAIIDSLGLPKDTFPVPSGLKNRPWFSAKGDTTYLWSVAQQKWIGLAGGGGGGAVASVFGRTGSVVALAADYAAFYPLLSGSYSNPTWITSLAWGKISGAPSFLTSESDPLFSASSAAGITAGNIANWNTAYNKKINGAAFTGTATKTLTLTHQDGTTTTATFNDNEGAPGGGITTLNNETGSTQSFATGSAGTDFGITSNSGTHTFNIPTASATNRGLLSAANWAAFNSKIGPADTSSMLSPYTHWTQGYLKTDPTTASNGLTKSANDIKLGGTITENTNISQGTNQLHYSFTDPFISGRTGGFTLNMGSEAGGFQMFARQAQAFQNPTYTLRVFANNYTDPNTLMQVQGGAVFLDAGNDLGEHKNISVRTDAIIMGTTQRQALRLGGTTYSPTVEMPSLVQQAYAEDRMMVWDTTSKTVGWRTIPSGGGGAETDPVFNASAASGITGTNISNWNTAYGWGNHSGLYAPITHYHFASDITSGTFGAARFAGTATNDYVLKIVGGVPTWSVDATGGGGGSSQWTNETGGIYYTGAVRVAGNILMDGADASILQFSTGNGWGGVNGMQGDPNNGWNILALNYNNTQPVIVNGANTNTGDGFQVYNTSYFDNEVRINTTDQGDYKLQVAGGAYLAGNVQLGFGDQGRTFIGNGGEIWAHGGAMNIKHNGPLTITGGSVTFVSLGGYYQWGNLSTPSGGAGVLWNNFNGDRGNGNEKVPGYMFYNSGINRWRGWDVATETWKSFLMEGDVSGGGGGTTYTFNNSSIVNTSNNLALAGDATTPGNNKVYGTDASGNKSFQQALVAALTNPQSGDFLKYNGSTNEWENFQLSGNGMTSSNGTYNLGGTITGSINLSTTNTAYGFEVGTGSLSGAFQSIAIKNNEAGLYIQDAGGNYGGSGAYKDGTGIFGGLYAYSDLTESLNGVYARPGKTVIVLDPITGDFEILGMKPYADDAAAGAAGLTTGKIYFVPTTGQVMRKL